MLDQMELWDAFEMSFVCVCHSKWEFSPSAPHYNGLQSAREAVLDEASVLWFRWVLLPYTMSMDFPIVTFKRKKQSHHSRYISTLHYSRITPHQFNQPKVHCEHCESFGSRIGTLIMQVFLPIPSTFSHRSLAFAKVSHLLLYIL